MGMVHGYKGSFCAQTSGIGNLRFPMVVHLSRQSHRRADTSIFRGPA